MPLSYYVHFKRGIAFFACFIFYNLFAIFLFTTRPDDTEVPVLSDANLGGIHLHLRGNLESYTWAGSNNKFIRLTTRCQGLPIYYRDEVRYKGAFLTLF
jgi:hypothetical protein